MTSELSKAVWQIDPVKSTMFVWARIPECYQDSSEFLYDLLDRTGVLVNAGTSFGEEGKRYVRFALVRSDEEVREAARRIAESGIFDTNDSIG